MVELMVALSVLAIIMALAAPSVGRMIGNSQVRGVADALQNGLRLAQAEATRRHRVTVFYRSESPVCAVNTAPSDKGAYWLIRVLPMQVGEAASIAQCGSVGDIGSPVDVTGPTAVCFSTEGRQSAQSAGDIGLGAGAVCTVEGAHSFDISSKRAERMLRVRVTSGGSVRLCDPARTYSTDSPDGCPT